MGVFDSEIIEIPCEGCGKKHPKKIGWIKTHAEVSCSCGATIKLDKDQFVRELAGVDKALDNLLRPRDINIKFRL